MRGGHVQLGVGDTAAAMYIGGSLDASIYIDRTYRCRRRLEDPPESRLLVLLVVLGKELWWCWLVNIPHEGAPQNEALQRQRTKPPEYVLARARFGAG